MKTVEDVARELAAAHRDADSDIQEIYFYPDPAGEEVRLVEVSGSVGNTGEVLPFRFAARPDLGVPYPSVVVLLSPEEKQALDSKLLALPANWGNPLDMRRIG